MSIGFNDFQNQANAASREQSSAEDGMQSAEDYQRNRQLVAMKSAEQFNSNVRNFNLEVNTSMLGSMDKISLAR